MPGTTQLLMGQNRSWTSGPCDFWSCSSHSPLCCGPSKSLNSLLVHSTHICGALLPGTALGLTLWQRWEDTEKVPGPPSRGRWPPRGTLAGRLLKHSFQPSCFRISGCRAWEPAFPQAVPGDSDVPAGLGSLARRRYTLKGPDRDLRKSPVPPVTWEP